MRLDQNHPYAIIRNAGGGYDHGLQQLFDDQLVLREAERTGVAMKPVYIATAIERLVERFYGGDRDALLRELDREGVTLDSFRIAVGEDMIVKSLRAAQTRFVEPDQRQEAVDEWLSGLRESAAREYAVGGGGR